MLVAVLALFASKPLRADASAQKVVWEYKLLVSGSFTEMGKDEPAGLNAMGSDGWELVVVLPDRQSLTNKTYYFKRPK